MDLDIAGSNPVSHPFDISRAWPICGRGQVGPISPASRGTPPAAADRLRTRPAGPCAADSTPCDNGFCVDHDLGDRQANGRDSTWKMPPLSDDLRGGSLARAGRPGSGGPCHERARPCRRCGRVQDSRSGLGTRSGENRADNHGQGGRRPRSRTGRPAGRRGSVFLCALARSEPRIPPDLGTVLVGHRFQGCQGRVVIKPARFLVLEDPAVAEEQIDKISIDLP